MPRITVIDSNKRRILLWDGKVVKAIPYDPYHSLKYAHFDGNRIFHAFGGDRRMRVEETYNDGIFNAYLTTRPGRDGATTEMVVQISDAPGLARAILADNVEEYGRMFNEWYGHGMQPEIVDYMLASGNPDRVRAVLVQKLNKGGGEEDAADGEEEEEGGGSAMADCETAYVVDGRFMVDGRGAAYYFQPRNGRNGEADGGNDEDEDEDADERRPGIDMGDWRYLCLVADGNGRDDENDGGEDVDVPGRGVIRMSGATRVVIAKIAFLLYPSMDSVFLNQLPRPMRGSVSRMIRDRGAY